MSMRPTDRRRARLGAVICVVLVPLSAPPALAQTATVTGQVILESRREPVPGATVSIIGTELSATTDGQGRFAILDVPPGVQRLQVRMLGWAAVPRALEMEAGSHTVVLLPVALDVLPLPSLSVSVERTAGIGKLTRFYRRLGHSPGIFLTRQDIDEIDPRETTDLFRHVPGVRVLRGNRGRQYVALTRRRGCGIQFYLDGSPVAFFSPDEVRPEDIAGIEVYRGLSETPVEFRRRTNCGVIVIWTRDPATGR